MREVCNEVDNVEKSHRDGCSDGLRQKAQCSVRYTIERIVRRISMEVNNWNHSSYLPVGDCGARRARLAKQKGRHKISRKMIVK